MVRQRALTKWCNLHLSERNIKLRDVVDLQDRCATAALLSVLTGRELVVTRKNSQEEGIQDWKRIYYFLESESGFVCEPWTLGK